MTRLKIHHLADGGTPQAAIAEKCRVSRRSVERILSEPVPTLPEVATHQRQSALRRGRPPKADLAIVEQVRALLAEDRSMRATEVLRRSRAWGYTGGKSALSALVKQLRPAPKVEPLVSFEGMRGEYAQFDFGKCWVKLSSGRRVQVIFFVGRLTHSRTLPIVLV
jgi:transposase